MILPSLHPPRAAAHPPRPLVLCTLDRHLGPLEAMSEWGSFLGADWCLCRGCGATLTTATALRQRSAA